MGLFHRSDAISRAMATYAKAKEKRDLAKEKRDRELERGTKKSSDMRLPNRNGAK